MRESETKWEEGNARGEACIKVKNYPERDKCVKSVEDDTKIENFSIKVAFQPTRHTYLWISRKIKILM